jgi:hypothetical protein
VNIDTFTLKFEEIISLKSWLLKEGAYIYVGFKWDVTRHDPNRSWACTTWNCMYSDFSLLDFCNNHENTKPQVAQRR